MARLIINEQDFSEKLKDFSFTCNGCGSNKVTLDIDWAAYPSCDWCYITIICENCKKEETLCDT